VQAPYGLVVRSPAHGNSIGYLRKGDLILVVQGPDLLSGLIDSKKTPVAHHGKSTNHYSFEDWTAHTSTSANLWSFNSENPSTALLGTVMDTRAH